MPRYRGQGFALLAKHHALRAAADAGIHRAMSSNDSANAPMLAINARLGYEPFANPALAERPPAGV